jgi:hypothetical protein
MPFEVRAFIPLVKPSDLSVKANTGAAKRQILFGADLNTNSSFLGNFLVVSLWGMSHVCRQAAFCTDYGVRSVGELWSNRGSLQRQRRCSPHDLRGAIPAFIHISDGKMHEVNVLDFMPIEAGAFYVMDRGYLDFTRLYAMYQAGGFFVTRAKVNMNARRIYTKPVDRSTGLICDQTVVLNGFYAARHYPENLRRIRFKDAETGKTFIFLTNNFLMPPSTIAALYKNRWQVELFFKWIKQHLRIKKFLGNSENAVKTQLWCAVSTYVLIAIVKKELQIKSSLYTLLQILSVSAFQKTELSSAFQGVEYSSEILDTANQLNLFGI